MARPKLKTEANTLKMSLEVQDLWERCAAQEHRSLTNMFEVMVRDCVKRLNVLAAPASGSPLSFGLNPPTAPTAPKANAAAITKTTTLNQ